MTRANAAAATAGLDAFANLSDDDNRCPCCGAELNEDGTCPRHCDTEHPTGKRIA